MIHVRPQGHNCHFTQPSFVPAHTSRFISLLPKNNEMPSNRDLQCGGAFMHDNHRAPSVDLYANQRSIMKEHNTLEKWRAACDDSQHFHRRRVACIADAVYLFVQNSANLVDKKP